MSIFDDLCERPQYNRYQGMSKSAVLLLANKIGSRLRKDLDAESFSIENASTFVDTIRFRFYFTTQPDLVANGPIDDLFRLDGPNSYMLYRTILLMLKEDKKTNRKKVQGGIYDDGGDPRLGLSGGVIDSLPFRKALAPDKIERAVRFAYAQTSTPTTPMKNYKNIVQLAQDEIMTTLKVKLVNNAYNIELIVRCYKEEARTLTVGDLVLTPVQTANGGGATHLQIAEVIEIHPSSVLGADSAPAELILGSVQAMSTLHKEQMAKEADMVERLKTIDAEESRKKAKANVLAALSFEEKKVLGLPVQQEEGNPS